MSKIKETLMGFDDDGKDPLRPNNKSIKSTLKDTISQPPQVDKTPEQIAKDEARRQMLFQTKKKSMFLSYLFWFLFGGFGAHRFYLGAKKAKVMLGLNVVSLFLMLSSCSGAVSKATGENIDLAPFAAAGGIGQIGILILAVWCIVDAFYIPGMVEKKNLELIELLTED